MLARVPGTERVLRMGPIHPVHPMGEGRGVAAVGLVMLGVVVGVYLVLLPIRRRIEGLAGHASRFGRGDLRARAVVGPPDAVAALESAFNRMAAEIERMVAAHQEMLRTVSHELRTPLQRMHFSLARAQDARADDERDGALGRVDRELDELDALVGELLTYARLQDGSAPAHRAADLREMLADLRDRFDGLNGKTVELRAAALVVTCDPHLLRRAATNLLVNAFEHARSRILVTAELRDGCAVLEVHDDGAGVATEDRERVFSPFWRSEERRATGRGFGLGLAIVRQIAWQHGGRAEVRAAPDLGGAAFRLTLPVGGAPADARARSRAA
jgi:two-component system sensor histidine kinase RstB